MHEGKHIHFSEADNKPLCSFSNKLCKQRRLNGYAFCIRHVLEDKSAPFRQCEFEAKYNRLRCTNPIPQDEDRRYCNSHLQVLGLVPKTVKKKKHPPPSSSNAPVDQVGRNNPETSRDDGTHEKHKKSKDKKKKKKKDKDKDKDKEKHKHAKGKSKSKKHNHISQLLNTSEQHSVNLNALSLLLQHSPPIPSPLNHGAANFDKCTKQTLGGGGGDRSRTKLKSDRGVIQHDRLQHKFEKNKQRLKLQRDKEIEARSAHQSAQGRLLSSPTRLSETASTTTTTPMQQPSFSGLLSSLLQHQSSLYPGYHLPILPSTSSSGVPHSHAHLGFPSGLPFQLPPPPHVPPSATVVLTKTRKPRELYKQKLKLPAVDKLREAFQEEEKKQIDLFPLGLEHSDDDADERCIEDDRLIDNPYRNTNLDINDSCCSSSDESPTFRPERIEHLRAGLRRKCDQLINTQKSHKAQRRKAKDMCLKLCKAAREHAFGTAVSLLRLKNQPLVRPQIQSPPERICCSREESGEECQEETLPYGRHCFRHILEDDNQMLYFQCSAEFPGGLRCIEPAFDVLNELPLCVEHAKRQRLQPKKRQRKKTKPSALTRPNKRKKQKQRRPSRPQKPIPPAFPMPHNAYPMNFATDSSSSKLSPTPEEEIDTNDIHLTSDMMGIDMNEHDLRIDLDGENGDLNYDEANDLSDLLPKLPMDMMLFGGKNGDSFMPTKEEQEEFERTILSEVSSDVKDVDVEASLEQLSQASLNQLSASQLPFGDSDNDDNGSGLPSDVGDDVLNSDGADGLPSDLQGAANRLLADTMRQNSVDALTSSLHPTVDLASTVPSTTQTATLQALANSLVGSAGGYQQDTGHFAAAHRHNNMTNDVMSLNHGTNGGMQHSPGGMQHSPGHQANLTNGMVPMNASAIMNQFRIKYSNEQAQSPHAGALSPHTHPMMSPRGANTQFTNPLLPTQPIASTNPLLSAALTAPPHSTHQQQQQQQQPMALPSFSQTWSNFGHQQQRFPNPHHPMMGNNGVNHANGPMLGGGNHTNGPMLGGGGGVNHSNGPMMGGGGGGINHSNGPMLGGGGGGVNHHNGPSMNLMGYPASTFPQKINFTVGPTETNLAKNPLLFNHQTAVSPATPSPTPTHGIQGSFLPQPQTPSPGHHPVMTSASTVIPVPKASPAQSGTSS